MDKQISVWLDDGAWIVSIDDEEGSDTVRWFDERDDAMRLARKLADDTGMEIEVSLPGLADRFTLTGEG